MSSNQENIEQKIQVEEPKEKIMNSQNTLLDEKMLGLKREAEYEIEGKRN